MEEKILIVIDMQNDFITGTLANPAAAAIVDKIENYLKTYNGHVLFTRDTHNINYLSTFEGRQLPIEHCISGTTGWEIEERLSKYANNTINKGTFGDAENIAASINELFSNGIYRYSKPQKIEFVGTVTEICVISNVLGLKPYFPDIEFVVHADMCAGLSEEGHKAALAVMKACQVTVIGG